MTELLSDYPPEKELFTPKNRFCGFIIILVGKRRLVFPFNAKESDIGWYNIPVFDDRNNRHIQFVINITQYTATHFKQTNNPPHISIMTNYQGKVKGRRKAPYPNSILDRKALIEALEEGGIPFKASHIDGFYQALHRQHYPPLPQFVENYYANERKEYLQERQQQQQQGRVDQDEKSDKDEKESKDEMLLLEGGQGINDQSSSHRNHNSTKVLFERNGNSVPIKNSITNRKNRNKSQLPKTFLNYLATTPDFVHSTSRVAKRLTSADMSTTKLIVELYDGFVVESVLMRYDKKGSGRASLCVSSQCGCAMGCTFCATGTMGLSGNLTTGEILEQLVHADRILAEEAALARQQKKDQEELDPHRQQLQSVDEKEECKESTTTTMNHTITTSTTKTIQLVRNVVFMGMGEPLDNYTNVTDACRAMIERTRWNLAHGRVTVSTVGLIPQIRRLTRELPEVSLALSLHAPNQAARTAIVPTAARYPIEGLIDALDNHMMVYVDKKKERNRREESDDNGIDNSTTTNAVVDDDGDTNIPTATATPTVYTVEERMRESSRRRAMIEYVMMEGETSSIECAHQLGRLCEGRQLVVNLIPYNATDVKDVLQCPPEAQLHEFKRIVQSYGTFCTIRRTMGADIASACGQLVQKDHKDGKNKDDTSTGQNKISPRNEQQRTIDIEDVIHDGKVNSNNDKGNNMDSTTTTTKMTMARTTDEVRHIDDGSGYVVDALPNEEMDKEVNKPTSKENADITLSSSSWIESLSVEDLERWTTGLATAMTISATLFIASSFLYVVKRRA
jgi:adenine C2-methylase RlmN of 23S rRNA A2503 and tRNA A37